MIWLIHFLRSWWENSSWNLSEVWRILKENGRLILAAALGLLAIFETLGQFVIGMVNYLVSRIDDLVFPEFDLSVSSSVADVLAMTNAVFPLDELCSYLVSFVLFYIAITLYRIIRSFVPWGTP